MLQRESFNLLFENSSALENDEPPYIPTGFSRAGLKTPPHIRKAIHDAIYEKSLEKEVVLSVQEVSVTHTEPEEESNDGTIHPMSDVVGKVTKHKIVGHSAYFLTYEEKCERNPALMKIEQTMHERVDEELRKMREAMEHHQGGGGGGGYLAVYNSASTGPTHSDHSEHSTPASSRPSSRDSQRSSGSNVNSSHPLLASPTGEARERREQRKREKAKNITSFADRLYGKGAKQAFTQKFMQVRLPFSLFSTLI